MARIERLACDFEAGTTRPATAEWRDDAREEAPGPAIGAAFLSVPAALLALVVALIAGAGLAVAMGLALAAQMGVFTAGLAWGCLLPRG